MEENRTRRALDELADLFLTGPTGGPPSAGASAEEDAPTEDTAADAPLDADTTDDQNTPARPDVTPESDAAGTAAGFEALAEFDLEGPPPIRLPPKAPPRSSYEPRRSLAVPATDEPSTPPADAPSHLRLHREDEAETETDMDSTASDAARPGRLPTSAPAQVEAVLLGNLPGLSGPWLTQYAQRLAQREGPVLLLHLDEQGLDLEMVEPTDRPQPPGRMPPGGETGDLVDRLEALMRLSPSPVRRVLVHVEASPQPMVLARLRALDAWTLLTGADDAATVAGYRLLKQMIESDPAATPRRVGVMMMGSDDEAACQGITRLRSAAGSVLDAPIELVGAQRQMVPVNIRQLGRFEPMQTLWPSLRRWLAGLDPAEPQPARDHVEAPAMSSSPEAESEVHTAAAADQPSPARRRPAAAAASPEPTPAPPRHAGPAAAAAKPGPTPAPPKQAAPSDQAPVNDTPDLATFLTSDQLPGGLALEARCPHQPDTELLLDQNGRLHLLRHHRPACGFATRSDDDLPALRQAMLELLEARAWVREHVDLLQLTQRQCRIDGKAAPVLHLFTHRADLATALTARLGSMLKLHLLQKVGRGDHATWFSTPLN